MKVTRHYDFGELTLWTTVCNIDVCIFKECGRWYGQSDSQSVNVCSSTYDGLLDELKKFERLMLNNGIEY